MSKTYLSIIIPVYNEEENVLPLYLELIKVLKSLKKSFEVVFINDCSSDETYGVLVKIAKKDKDVKVINFSRNCGQTAALSAGIDYSKGEIIIPMDGDLQNDPKDIPKLLKKIKEGYSVVSGWRKNRKDAFIRVLSSKIANWIIRIATKIKIHDNGCTLKAYKREVIEDVQLYGEMHRFISVYAMWSGGKVAEVVVNHRERKHGVSKYGFSRIFKVVLDLLVINFIHKYINRPIHFFGKYGFISIVIGFIFAIWSILLKVISQLSINRTPLPVFSAMFIIVGIQLILSGILAELMMRTYYESQDKKAYKIKNIINI